MDEIIEKRQQLLLKVQTDELYFKIFMVDIRLLAPQDSKSRVIEDAEFEQLRKSIKLDPDFLKVRFPVINMYKGREWKIIAGDKRVKAAIAEGVKEIPVMFVNVDPSKEKEWMIKDNKHSGKWDEVELKKELIELHDSGYNMESLSFTPSELTTYFNDPFQNRDPAGDPENKGTTPRKFTKGKIRFGAAVECPQCHEHFSIKEDDLVEE